MATRTEPQPHGRDIAPPRKEPEEGDVLVGTSYRALGELGHGGMGTVYLAEHRDLGRRFAVKVLLPELTADEVVVERLRREARAASQIRHPGIVDVTDFGETRDGRTFVVMEHLEGEDLRERLEGDNPMPPEEAVPIIAQVCLALAAAHDAGVIHRDIKPENIFLVTDGPEQGRVKVLDFGLALSPEHQKDRLTRRGVAWGTPEYMAPEQAAGRKTDARTDVYSTGAVLYELLTGAPPFDEETAVETMARKLHEAPEPPSELVSWAAIPPALDQLVVQALAPESSDRFSSILEMGRALEAMSADFDSDAGAQDRDEEDEPGGLTDVDEVTLDPPPPRPLWSTPAAMVAAVVVACGLGAALYFSGAGGSPVPSPAPVVDALPDAAPAPAPSKSPPSIEAGPPPSAHADSGSDTEPATAAPEVQRVAKAPRAERVTQDGDRSGEPQAEPDRAEQVAELLSTGRSHLRRRQLAQAQRAFAEVARVAPGNTQAQDGLGRVAFEQGDHALAARHLERALQGRPGSIRSRLLLGSAYLRLGRRADAVAQWQQVLERDPDNRGALQSLQAVGQ